MKPNTLSLLILVFLFSPQVFLAQNIKSLSLANIKTEDGQYGVIDKSGKPYFHFIQSPLGHFSDGGLAPIVVDERLGFLNLTGTIVTSYPDLSIVGISEIEGMIHVEKNGKIGFVDQSGKLVIPCIYEDVTEFDDGIAQVKKEGKWGFMMIPEIITKEWQE